MHIDILTVLPGLLESPFQHSMMKRAQDKGLLTIEVHSLRQWAVNEYGQVDDYQYGGGAGMVMMCEPLAFSAVSSLCSAKLPKVMSDESKMARGNASGIRLAGWRTNTSWSKTFERGQVMTKLAPVLSAHWDEKDSFTIDAYTRHGGYKASAKALAMDPDAVKAAEGKKNATEAEYKNIAMSLSNIVDKAAPVGGVSLHSRRDKRNHRVRDGQDFSPREELC